MKTRAITITRIETELGQLIAGATERGVCLLKFADHKHLGSALEQLTKAFKAPVVEGVPYENPHLQALGRQISQYFAGDRREFDIPLDIAGTEFQKRVWLGLRQIPYGHTMSYGKQAELLGCPASVRAVAGANGKNKISIIVPCHRVIGSDGSLTGYAGGLWRKERLLELEGVSF